MARGTVRQLLKESSNKAVRLLRRRDKLAKEAELYRDGLAVPPGQGSK